MSSLMGKLFGGGKPAGRAPAQSSTAASIQQLREVIEMLDKKSKLYDQKILDELKEAKRLGTKNKKEAMRHMVRKARYVKQQQQVEGQRDTLEAQITALEMSSIQSSVVGAMKNAGKALHSNLQDADDIGDVLDDVQEGIDRTEEISTLLGNTTFGTADADMDDLEKELEDMEHAELDEELLGVDMSGIRNFPEAELELPSVPARPVPSKPQVVKVDDDAELAELAAWVNG